MSIPTYYICCFLCKEMYTQDTKPTQCGNCESSTIGFFEKTDKVTNDTVILALKDVWLEEVFTSGPLDSTDTETIRQDIEDGFECGETASEVEWFIKPISRDGKRRMPRKDLRMIHDGQDDPGPSHKISAQEGGHWGAY